jgi:hypothetical protein
MWPTKDDSDGHAKNTFSKMRFTSSNDNSEKSFIADSERYLRKRMNSNKNDLLQSISLTPITWVRVMVFNATFNNISVISWQSVSLV